MYLILHVLIFVFSKSGDLYLVTIVKLIYTVIEEYNKGTTNRSRVMIAGVVVVGGRGEGGNSELELSVVYTCMFCEYCVTLV